MVSSPRLVCLLHGVREPDTDDWAQTSELPVLHCNISLAPPWPGAGAKDVVQCSRSSAAHWADGWEEKGRAQHGTRAMYNPSKRGLEEREHGRNFIYRLQSKQELQKHLWYSLCLACVVWEESWVALRQALQSWFLLHSNAALSPDLHLLCLYKWQDPLKKHRMLAVIHWECGKGLGTSNTQNMPASDERWAIKRPMIRNHSRTSTAKPKIKGKQNRNSY